MTIYGCTVNIYAITQTGKVRKVECACNVGYYLDEGDCIICILVKVWEAVGAVIVVTTWME